MPICARLGVWCLIVTIVTIPYACLILSSDCQFNVCEKNFGNFSFCDMILEKVGGGVRILSVENVLLTFHFPFIFSF